MIVSYKKNDTSVTILHEGLPVTLTDWSKKQLLNLKNEVKNFIHFLSLKNYGRWSTTIRGPDAVRENLISGLQKIGYRRERIPRISPAPWVGVLSGAMDILPWAIQAKKNGQIEKLIAGPNLIMVPEECDSIITDPAIDSIITPSKWVSDLYRELAPELDSRLVEWAVGVDTDYWSAQGFEKTLDFLIYNKSSSCDVDELNYVTTTLDQLNLKYSILEYGKFNPCMYRYLLRMSRAMIYLGRTESQGIGLFEAWSSNVATLVRSCDKFVFENSQYKASAAPYMTNLCGLFFSGTADFLEKLNVFLCLESTFTPRNYVLENYTLERSAQQYLDIYHRK